MPSFPPKSPPHLLTLIVISGAGALSMNVFLPSLPGMARYFQVDYALIQLTVSVYLVATALLQLIIGPLSDRFGRRPVLIWSFVLFNLATIGAIFSPSFEFLLLMRVFQAFSASGMVLSRAIVRDMVEPAAAAGMIGYITMGMAMAPMVAPAIGGFLDEIYGWQATFALLFVVGMGSLVILLLDLGETNQRRNANFRAQFRAYPELFRSRRFWAYAMICAFTSGQFFAFLGGGPYVATEIMRLTPSEYGILFGLISAGYVLGNFLSGRFAGRIGIARMMLTGNSTAFAGLLVSIALMSAGIDYPIVFFGPVVLVGLGNGLVLPSAVVGIVSVRPHLAGSASGLGASLQIGFGALFSVLGGAFLTPTSGAFPLSFVMALACLASVSCALYVIRLERLAARPGTGGAS